MNTPFASNTLYYGESDRDLIRPKHQMAVPGLGVFIAPNAVARLFQFHDYTKCPPLGNPQKKTQRVLYPILRPNVMHCPRYYHLRQAAPVQKPQEEATFAPPSEDTQFMAHIGEPMEVYGVIDGSLTKQKIIQKIGGDNERSHS